MIKNVHGNTVDHLGRAIMSGRYPPGSTIPPEPLLCDELGVSRTVVREAVKSLIAKGLVSSGPKVGTRVLPADQWNWFDPDVVVWQSKVGLTREYLRDLQELRRVVEPAAVRMAAERATPADIAEIEAAYGGMKR
ncbi:MAG TPA: GntR family transcriptional regulator, partial [Ramlibacter sp.]|nr:GntR family transcriptional regulator [Ramlibacter sp.]